jgi:hypothetical protein
MRQERKDKRERPLVRSIETNRENERRKKMNDRNEAEGAIRVRKFLSPSFHHHHNSYCTTTAA